jgi:predicted transposase YbfD/YdcC
MYDLPHVLLCCILAVAAGADSYRAIVRFLTARLEWLHEHTELRWRRAPSHTGLRRILLGLDHEAIEQALRRRARAALDGDAQTQGCTIALDGKTLRGSIDRFAERAALQWLSAFATGQQLVLGQVSWHSGDKDDEIAAARRLIEELGLKGKLFTLDALHCQKKTLKAVLDSGNDVLVQVKANQPTLLGKLTALAQQTPSTETAYDADLGQRNRIEQRRTTVWPVDEAALGAPWSGMRCAIEVSRHTEVFDTARGEWKPRCETAWYLCTRELSAREGQHSVREHWAVENRLHHVRDVTFGEDASRIRTSPGIFAQLRSCALNLLRQAGCKNMKGARQNVGWSERSMLEMLHKLQR